jgi:hypothetical protein
MCSSNLHEIQVSGIGKYYGMSQQAINYITSFLSNRTKTVILENITSEKIPVTPGVPQGTALDPRLLLGSDSEYIAFVGMKCH